MDIRRRETLAVTAAEEDPAFLGECVVLEFNSDATAPERWRISKIVRLPAKDLRAPRTPGNPSSSPV